MSIFAVEGRHPTFPDDRRFWVAPTAVVIGNVRLKQDASVWFGAVLRGDNEPIIVGERSNIQENCILHTDMGYPMVIGADCTIGHGVILHGCTLGQGTLIGMGATVLNGATIGKNCLVGANALVTEGKIFEEGSLIVGSPARSVRKLTDDQIAGLRASAAHYVDNARRYSKTLIVARSAPL